jgi:putative MATE family efflux protein
MLVMIVDTMLVGHLGTAELAAVSLTTQWVYMAITLFTTISTGATALIARSVGAKDLGTANRALRQALALALGIGLLASVLALALATPAVKLMGADADTLAHGVLFLRITALSFVLQSIMWVGNACLRGAGDTRTAMVVMGIVNVINILVAWVAINGPFGLPKLGVAGSALGATVARGIGGLLVLGVLLRGRAGLKLSFRGLAPDREIIRRLLNVGLPTGIERLIMRFGMMAFLRAISSIGTVAVAAHAVALRAESLSFMPGFGFGVAGTTLVGQGLGARDPDRAERSGYLTFRLAMWLMIVMGVVFVVLPRPLIALFTSDPAVINTAVVPLRVVGFVQPFMAAGMVFPGNLRGAGDTRYPMLVTSASVWAIRVPLAYLLGPTLGLTGAWLGMAIDNTVRGTLFYLRFRGGRWKQAKV